MPPRPSVVSRFGALRAPRAPLLVLGRKALERRSTTGGLRASGGPHAIRRFFPPHRRSATLALASPGASWRRGDEHRREPRPGRCVRASLSAHASCHAARDLRRSRSARRDAQTSDFGRGMKPAPGVAAPGRNPRASEALMRARHPIRPQRAELLALRAHGMRLHPRSPEAALWRVLSRRQGRRRVSPPSRRSPADSLLTSSLPAARLDRRSRWPPP